MRTSKEPKSFNSLSQILCNKGNFDRFMKKTKPPETTGGLNDSDSGILKNPIPDKYACQSEHILPVSPNLIKQKGDMMAEKSSSHKKNFNSSKLPRVLGGAL